MFNNQKIVIETGKLAKQADQAFLVKWNDSALLVTLCYEKTISDVNFLPLTVEFQENLFAVGKIPGSFFKREGRASEHGVLSSRLIDRSIRCLLPNDFFKEIQIFVNPLAIDYKVDATILGIFGASLALNNSSLPIDNLFAGVTIGYINKEFVVNPTGQELKNSKLELIISGTKKGLHMIENKSSQLNEEEILTAIKFGHQKIVELIDIQEKFLNELREKTNLTRKIQLTMNAEETKKEEKFQNELIRILKETFSNEIDQIFNDASNQVRKMIFQELEIKVQTYFETNWKTSKFATENPEFSENYLQLSKKYLTKYFKNKIRENIINDQKRIDNRDLDELRKIECEVNYLKNVHGSAIFTRGGTQTLSTLTLGSLANYKIIDDLTQEEKQYFMHHYRSLPFSMGLVKRMRGISRREIGHGSLGLKAIKQVLPRIESFPYTVRLVTEVLDSNGSTSQAAICSASLALVTGGVPIKNMVAGIGIGLVKDQDKYHLLTDIQAWEDFYGDMDFKISGTKNGICSMQLDLKIDSLPIEIIGQALEKAKTARLKILEIMNNAVQDIEKPSIALKHIRLRIDPAEIGLVIGTNGRNIKKIMQEFNHPEIDIREEGEVLIYHKSEKILKAIEKNIKDLIQPVELNKVYAATIIKVKDYGVFAKIDDNSITGFIHISKLANKYVNNVNDVVRLNQKIKMEAIDITDKKKLSFKLVK